MMKDEQTACRITTSKGTGQYDWSLVPWQSEKVYQKALVERLARFVGRPAIIQLAIHNGLVVCRVEHGAASQCKSL